MNKTVTIIVAMDNNLLIGTDNKLPWDLAFDMKHFKLVTTGHTVIMGRKTWESIPAKYRPLPNRQNIVMSRNPLFSDNGCEVARNLEEAVGMSKNEKTFVIGGSEIYKEAIKTCDDMLITHVDANKTGDAWFPNFDAKDWAVLLIAEYKSDGKNDFDFQIKGYRRVENLPKME